MLVKFDCSFISVEIMKKLNEFITIQLENKNIKYKTFSSIEDTIKYVMEKDIKDEHIIILEENDDISESNIENEEYLWRRNKLFRTDNTFIVISNSLTFSHYKDFTDEEFYHILIEGKDKIMISDIIGWSSTGDYIHRGIGILDLKTLKFMSMSSY